MRSLSGTLIAAQKSPASYPHPKVEVFDRVAGITRLTWTRLYTGAEPENFHAAAMPGDGSLIRLRIDPSYNLWYSRVTSPGPASDYSSWTSWACSAYAVTICAYGVNVWIFAIGPEGKLWRKDSADSGVSFGAWIDMGAVGGTTATRLACCAKSSTAAIVLYSQSNAVYRRRLSGGSWEAAAAWSNSVNSITGLAVAYMGDWNIVICGTETTSLKPHVWTCLLGDGYSAAPGSWTALVEHTMAEAGSNVSFAFPCLDFPDVFRAFFVEAYSGSESYSRPYWTNSLATADFISNLWREPVPFNLTSTYGLALCSGNGYVWLTRPDGVWRASLTPASVELTADVLLLTSDIREASGNISITLRNDDGRYNTLGTGTYAALKLGSEVLFSPGYRTTAGIEVSSGQAYWITGWEYLSLGPESAFIVKASDAWSLLERWRPRRQYTWASGSKNIFQILNWIHARAGLELSSVSNSDAIVNQYPAFTINPGENVKLTVTQPAPIWHPGRRGHPGWWEHPSPITMSQLVPNLGASGKTEVLRLLAMVPDVLYFRGSYGYIINPLAADASAYSYGSGVMPHQVLEGRYITRSKETNRAQVFGSSVFTEDWDWGEIELVTDLLTQAKDINLTTTTSAHERGAAELRDASIHAIDGVLLVPLNCVQELYDVVDITDAIAGLTAAKRRVLSLSHIYNPIKGQYVLKIGLGGV